MKLISCALLLLLLSFCDAQSESAAKVNEPDFSCTPDTQFMDDCNMCTCDSSGRLARCTLMNCPPKNPAKRSVECSPGEANFDGCNNCQCTQDGSWSCTKKQCFSLNLPTTPSTVAKCTAGETKKQECNTCRCTITGLWACTRRACIPDNHDRVPATTPSGLQSRFNEHEIHDSNDSDGNTQTTTDFGIRVPVKGSHNKNENGGSSTVAPSVQRTIRPYHPSGTANRIVTEAELQDPHFKCVPSLSFKVDCNTCWCAADGKGARSCTRVACKPKTYAPLNPQ